MSDRIFLSLSEGRALGFDSNQWILHRRANRKDEWYWQPIRFVGSSKTILRRILREKGIQPTPEAQTKIDALSERFLDWVNTPERRMAA